MSRMREIDAHFDAYEHLKHLPREAEALLTLRKVASLVKPIMRKRGFRVGTLAEFLPDEPQLLGLNVNRGERILIRLRYHHDSRQFIDREQVVDTLLHELSHNVWGPHDHNFHNLWNELREEHQSLIAKGYTGEGFLSQGRQLGGKRIPLDEMRRQARIAAEKRRLAEAKAGAHGGKRLGGSKAAPGVDMRKVIADAATRRNSITKGCASGTNEAGKLNHDAAKGGFRTRAEEDDANDRAIAQALQELMEEEESQRLEDLCAPTGGGGLAWDRENGLSFDSDPPPPRKKTPTPPRNPNLSLFPKPRPTPTLTRLAPPPGQNSQGRPVSRLVAEHSTSKSRPRTTKPVTTRLPPRLVSEEESNYRNKQLPAAPIPGSTSITPIHVPSSSPTLSSPTLSIPDIITAPSGPLPGPGQWACPICTLINPLEYLACDACGLEQPPQPIPVHQRFGSGNGMPANLPAPPPARELRGPGVTPFEPANGRKGWNCLNCGCFMEDVWWTCRLCGEMKVDS